MNGQMVNFRDSSVQALAWFWDFGDGFYSDLEDPQHYFNEPGTYYVCECVTNPCHVETFCDSVTVTVSGTGDFTRYDQLLLYPNPARNRVSLQMIPSGGSPGTLSLWTVQGTLTRQWIPIPDPGKGQITLDIGGIPQGIYILETKFGGLIRLNKLIIL
jgi:PKD repeat protein